MAIDLNSHGGFVHVQKCLHELEKNTYNEGDVKLGGDSYLTFGRLTVFQNGEWHTVCSKEWSKSGHGA